MSIVCNERFAEYGVRPLTGSVGDSYDKALAENVNGSCKNELIDRRVWHGVLEVEIAMFEWVIWWKEGRLHEALD